MPRNCQVYLLNQLSEFAIICKISISGKVETNQAKYEKEATVFWLCVT